MQAWIKNFAYNLKLKFGKYNDKYLKKDEEFRKKKKENEKAERKQIREEKIKTNKLQKEKEKKVKVLILCWLILDEATFLQRINKNNKR